MSHVKCLLLAPATSPVPLRRLPQLPVRGRRGRSIARGSRGRGGKTNGGRGRGGGDKGTSTGDGARGGKKATKPSTREDESDDTHAAKDKGEKAKEVVKKDEAGSAEETDNEATKAPKKRVPRSKNPNLGT